MSEKLITIAGQGICFIGQYEENQYWMGRESNTCAYTTSTQGFFNVDPYKRFQSKEKCEEYVKKQVIKICKRILKEQGND